MPTPPATNHAYEALQNIYGNTPVAQVHATIAVAQAMNTQALIEFYRLAELLLSEDQRTDLLEKISGRLGYPLFATTTPRES